MIQPVLVALAIAYAELLRSVGVEPDAVVGHSMGEVAAACIAGALDIDQAMQVVCARSALMRRVSGQGAMALVDLPMAELRGRLAGVEDRVSVAASNGPRSSVISGAPEAVAAVMAGLEKDGVFCRLVKVDVASHSPQMEPLAAELADGAGRVDAGGRFLCRSIRPCSGGGPRVRRSTRVIGRATCGEPVLFSTAVGQLADDGVTVFLELGPHPILLPSVQQTVPTATTIACARRDEPEQAAFLTMLGSLWAAGAPIDWRRVMPEGGSAGARCHFTPGSASGIGSMRRKCARRGPLHPRVSPGPTKRPGAGFIAWPGRRPTHRQRARRRSKPERDGSS